MTSIIIKDLPKPASARRLAWLLGFAVVAVIAIVFGPVVQAGFVAWDDDVNIYRNPHIQSFSVENMGWMLTETKTPWDYKPLSWLTWTLLHACAGARPAAYHWLSLILHCVNGVLLFLLIPKMLRLWAGDSWNLAHHRHSYIAAAIATSAWALHPLQVESVAWASALPYGQALFFTLLSLWFYLHPYVSHSSETQVRLCYWASFACFVAALFSNAIVLMYPALLILLERYLPPDYGLDGTGLLARKRSWWIHVPFVTASGCSVALAVLARCYEAGQPWGRPPSLAAFGILERTMQAFYVWAHHLWKVLLPQPLSPVYTTLASFDPRAPAFLASAGAMIFCSYVLFRLSRRWPTAWRVWLAHLVLILPVLGLTEHPHFTSDRNSLFTGVLWALVLAGLWYKLCLQSRYRFIALGLSTFLLCGFAGLSASQLAVWQDSINLFSHTLQNNPPGTPYYPTLAILRAQAFVDEKMYPEAIDAFNRLLANAPNEAAAHHAIAGLYFDTGNLEKANFHYREALRLRPAEPTYYNNIGVLLIAKGESVLANDFFERAVAIDPEYPAAYHNLGLLLNEQGSREEGRDLLDWARLLHAKNSREPVSGRFVSR